MTLAACEQLLKDSMGLDVATIGASAIERAVRQRLQACRLPDVRAYWEYLRGSQTELQELIDAVVVPETWFFRDRESFAALARLTRDELLPASPTTPLRMLSVPCATGEEPYSMVMTLLDAGVPEERFRVEAVDICERLLIHARRGVYGRGSFRGRDLAYRARHFEPNGSGGRGGSGGSGYLLSESVRKQVRFHQGNLLAPDFLPGTARYEVIFCRNVLIYFDRPTQDRALAVLTRLLTPNGVLFAGPAESSVVIEHDFRSAKLPLAFAFRKGDGDAAATRRAIPLMPGMPVTPAAPAAPSQSLRQTTAIARALPPTQSHRSGSPSNGMPSNGKPPNGTPSNVSPPKVAPPARVPVPRVSHSRNSERHVELDEARALADRGRFDEAAGRCDAYMQKHGPSADAFFLLGLVRDASGRASDAEASYRKAIYLDQHHEQALLHLALLLERQGRSEARVLRQRLRRVAAILKAAGPHGDTEV